MKKIKILFQGDSLTDGDRDRSDMHNLGESYPKYAAAALAEKYPNVELEFVNLGIGGDRTDTLLARAQSDFVDIDADVVSILVGVNDIWNRYDLKIPNTDEVIEANYRALLQKVKSGTNAKIMLIQPYTVGYAQAWIRDEMIRVHAIVKRLADEFADAYMPIDDILWGEGIDPATHTRDGVHLKAAGAEFVGERYAQYVSPVIDQLLN
jgi:lysophospholipase L1-like esterase